MSTSLDPPCSLLRQLEQQSTGIVHERGGRVANYLTLFVDEGMLTRGGGNLEIQ
jgi:hypothetical protein